MMAVSPQNNSSEKGYEVNDKSSIVWCCWWLMSGDFTFSSPPVSLPHLCTTWWWSHWVRWRTDTRASDVLRRLGTAHPWSFESPVELVVQGPRGEYIQSYIEKWEWRLSNVSTSSSARVDMITLTITELWLLLCIYFYRGFMEQIWFRPHFYPLSLTLCDRVFFKINSQFSLEIIHWFSYKNLVCDIWCR